MSEIFYPPPPPPPPFICCPTTSVLFLASEVLLSPCKWGPMTFHQRTDFSHCHLFHPFSALTAFPSPQLFIFCCCWCFVYCGIFCFWSTWSVWSVMNCECKLLCLIYFVTCVLTTLGSSVHCTVIFALMAARICLWQSAALCSYQSLDSFKLRSGFLCFTDDLYIQEKNKSGGSQPSVILGR